MNKSSSLELYLLSFMDDEIDPSCEQASVFGKIVISQIAFETLAEIFPNVNPARTLQDFSDQFGDLPHRNVDLDELLVYSIEETTHKDWEKIFSSAVVEFFKRAAKQNLGLK